MVFHRELRVPLTLTLPLQLDISDKTLEQIVHSTQVADKLILDNTLLSFEKKNDKQFNKKARHFLSL